jgi:hypothetical protein
MSVVASANAGGIVRWSHCQRAAFLAIVASVLCMVCGCHKPAPLPETYPVHGRVVFANGKPAPGGAVTFQQMTDTSVASSGTIGPDGTFTITSFRDNQRQPGAVAGRHRVMVTPPIEPQRGMLFPVKIFSEPYVVKPGDNEFTLTIN